MSEAFQVSGALANLEDECSHVSDPSRYATWSTGINPVGPKMVINNKIPIVFSYCAKCQSVLLFNSNT